ncbi:MAG: hypothetical protein ACAH88_01445, partial [Roseimicrobium sp.]
MKIQLALLISWCLAIACPGAETPKDASITFKCQVLSGDGKPVPGARVYVNRPATRECILDDPIIAQGVTDAEGWFRASCTASPNLTYFDASIIADAGKDGIGVGRVFYRPPMESPQAGAIKLMPASELKATILTPEGTPAAGLELWVMAFALPGREEGPGGHLFGDASPLPGGLWRARTDEQGKLCIPQLPTGLHVYLKHGDSRWAQFKGRYHIFVEPLVKVDDTERTLQLAVPATMRGRILLPDGTPAGGSIVSIIDGVHPYVTAHGDEVKANERGEFVIDQIPPATYKLHYETEPPHFKKWIGSEKADLKVTAGQTLDLGDLVATEAAYVTGEVVDAETGKVVEEPLTFRLAAGQHDLHYQSQRYPKPEYHPPGNDDSVQVQVKGGEEKKVTFKLRPVKPEELVSGVVLDEAGNPVENARVAILGYGDRPFPTMAGSDKEGKFKLVRERGASQEMVLAWTEKAMSNPVPVEPGKSPTVRLREHELGKISGIVVDEADQPIAGAKISWNVPATVCLGGPVVRQVQSDAAGRFEFPRFWSDMEGVSFFCQAAGLGNVALRDVEVLSGTVTELKFTMKKADKTVSGQLVDAAGKPMVGLWVYAGNAKATTDMDGRFRISGLAPGRVHVRAILKTEDLTSEAKKWANAGDADVKLVLPAADGEVTGIVVNHAGKPVPLAKVESYDRDRKTTTDAAGRFKLGGVVKGWFTVDVKARTDDGEKAELRVRLKSGMKDVKITLPEKSREMFALPAEPVDLIGKTAPQVEYTKWMNSDPLGPHGRGKVRILDFWGLECSPCIATFPKVQKFWEAHKDKGIEIVATTSFYPEQEVKEFL